MILELPLPLILYATLTFNKGFSIHNKSFHYKTYHRRCTSLRSGDFWNFYKGALKFQKFFRISRNKVWTNGPCVNVFESLVFKWVDFVFFQIILVSSSAWYSSWFFVLVLFDPDREFCYGLRRSLGISSADKCAEKCRSASCCEAWQIRNKNECWTGIPVRCLQVISVHFKMILVHSKKAIFKMTSCMMQIILFLRGFRSLWCGFLQNQNV